MPNADEMDDEIGEKPYGYGRKKKSLLKRLLVKYVTQREVRDLHMDLAGKINALDPRNVLDIAPPHGFDLSTIINAEYTSIGLTGRRLDIAHDLNGCPYPVKDKSYDVVVLSHILEHLDNPAAALSEAFRIARQYVIVALPTESSPSSTELSHAWEYGTAFTLNRRVGRCLPRPLRKLLCRCPAKSIMFTIKVG